MSSVCRNPCRNEDVSTCRGLAHIPVDGSLGNGTRALVRVNDTFTRLWRPHLPPLAARTVHLYVQTSAACPSNLILSSNLKPSSVGSPPYCFGTGLTCRPLSVLGSSGNAAMRRECKSGVRSAHEGALPESSPPASRQMNLSSLGVRMYCFPCMLTRSLPKLVHHSIRRKLCWCATGTTAWPMCRSGDATAQKSVGSCQT